ncbi:MAG: 3'-5' exonuclease, partial [Ectothiorhodospiraceae bacterium]|nr:3'-5' exonuclease [Ectothiorhodospiraceae bacterium]
QRIKTERRLLDFADLEWRAYRLLVSGDNALWVQYKLDRRIDHLLIDEFQDTNPTQWQLVLPLLEELAAGDPERARSVFLVGDAKQSIYGFRRANPEVQKTAAAWLDERLGGGEHRLDASRRSSPAIIDVVNRIFGEGPLHDALPDFETHDTHLKALWGRFELLPLVTPDGQPDTTPDTRPALRDPLREPRPDPDEDLHHEEGRRIAARIRELVATGTVIGEGDRARTLDYGDVFILTRSRTHIGAIERALHEAGIPYLSADRGTLLEHLEIRDLEALLRILITPFDDLALAQVLKSPLFGADDADLERIATTQGKGWYERLRTLAEHLPDDHRLAIAAARLARWRELAGHLPVHDLLDRIFLEGDVPARYQTGSSEENAPRVAANLGRFLELALEVDSGRYPSLVHFLWRLRTLRDAGQEAPDAPPLRGAGRRVRLLTIHASKGLEAPVVFLVDSAGVNRNNRDTHTALVDWPADAARPRLIQLVQRSAERDRTSAERLDRAQTARQREEANLLYVALTRARQVLIVSGSGREPAGWYGQIHERLTDFLPEDDAGRWVHERNAMPPAASTETVVPREIDVPPALARPMFADASGNVAPSATAGGVEVDEDALARGIAIHRLLEWLSDGVPATEAALRLMLGMETAPDPRALDEWLTEATATRESPALAELFDPARFERAWNEVPLLYSDGARRVHGSIDRLIDDGDRLLIVDYKTHRIGAGAEDAVAARYHEALALYARGVQRLWPQRRVETALVFTATRRLVNVAWRDA